jgi:hypothetical protein
MGVAARLMFQRLGKDKKELSLEFTNVCSEMPRMGPEIYIHSGSVLAVSPGSDRRVPQLLIKSPGSKLFSSLTLGFHTRACLRLRRRVLMSIE